MKESLSRFELGWILVVAAVPRLVGLGHVSLWLDEILSSLRVGLSFPEAWEAWKGNPVHPPLSELTQWVWFRLVEPEPLRRMLPIAFGILTVGLLARLTCGWFGRRAAWATALIAALSPLHVRYSQELRGYSLGLLVLVLVLLANESALERRSLAGWAILGISLSLCYWSLYIAAIVLLPILLSTIQVVARRSTRRRELVGFALALMLSGILFAPWFSVVERAATKIHEQEATRWTWSLLGRRLEFLTVGGVEGAALSTGAVLFAAFLAAGLVAALSSLHGRSVIAGVLAGSVGIEAVLWLTDHWSNGRYNLASWPFLVMLAGLGCAKISTLVMRSWLELGGGRWHGAVGHAVSALPLAAMLLFETVGVADYFRRGRPDWQSVARTVSAMAAPDRPILVSNGWTRVSLGYYLSQLEGSHRADISTRPQIVDSSVAPAELLGRDCSVLVDSSRPTPKAMEELLVNTPAQRGFPRSGARVAVGEPVEGDLGDPWSCLPAEVDQAAGERPSPRFLRLFEGFRRSRPRGMEFTAEDQPHLRYGWSYPELTPKGMTFRWAVGHWAAIDLPERSASTLRLEVWSLAAGQILSVYRNRQLLASRSVGTSRQTLEVSLPSDFGAAGGEIVVFRFSRYASPQENPRPLAVGFDRLSLLP